MEIGEAVAEVLRNTARDVLGETSGKGGRADRDTRSIPKVSFPSKYKARYVS